MCTCEVNSKPAMSCELNAIISVFILSAIALHLNCRSFSATTEQGGTGYSGESSLLYNFAKKPAFSRQLQSGALEFKETNSNVKRYRRTSSKLHVSADFPNRNRNETLPLPSSKYVSEFQSNDSAPIRSTTENTALTSFHKRAFEIEDGFQGDAPGVFTLLQMWKYEYSSVFLKSQIVCFCING